MLDAWPNLSHLENASVFVTVRIIAMTLHVSHARCGHLVAIHAPTRLNQMNFSLASAKTAIAIQHAGDAYNAIQKNRLSVAFTCLVSGAALSKTQ